MNQGIRSVARVLLVALIAVALALGASIGYFNARSVRFDYLLGDLELPLIALLIGTFALGVMVALAVAAAHILRLRFELRRMRIRIRDHETELRNLRNLPLGTESRPATNDGTVRA